jgi:hypothetical protein
MGVGEVLGKIQPKEVALGEIWPEEVAADEI